MPPKMAMAFHSNVTKEGGLSSTNISNMIKVSAVKNYVASKIGYETSSKDKYLADDSVY